MRRHCSRAARSERGRHLLGDDRVAGGGPVAIHGEIEPIVAAPAQHRHQVDEGDVLGTGERTLTDTTFTDRLRARARSEDVPFVNLLPLLRRRRDDGLYFPMDGHWTPTGNAVVAAEVAGAFGRDPGVASSDNRGVRIP